MHIIKKTGSSQPELLTGHTRDGQVGDGGLPSSVGFISHIHLEKSQRKTKPKGTATDHISEKLSRSKFRLEKIGYFAVFCK